MCKVVVFKTPFTHEILPVQPVYTRPCKFCYRLQYFLHFKNLHGSAGSMYTKGRSVQVFVRSKI